jgi:glycerol-3-phosphate cytidylyltransferase
MSNKILYTGGTFDLFHYGHINFLKKCYAICENVIVALNTDEFVNKYKAKPIMTYEEREQSLKECKYVSKVIPHTTGFDSKPTIKVVNPNIIAIGDDWCHKDYYEQMGFDQKWLDNNNIVLVYIPYTKGISTSEIKHRINEQNQIGHI